MIIYLLGSQQLKKKKKKEALANTEFKTETPSILKGIFYILSNKSTVVLKMVLRQRKSYKLLQNMTLNLPPFLTSKFSC